MQTYYHDCFKLFKKKKIKHEFSLLCGENQLNYSHIVIRIFLRDYIFLDPILILYSQNKKKNFKLINLIGKKLYETNKALKKGSETPRLRDYLDIKKFSSALYFVEKKIKKIKLRLIDKPRSIKTKKNFYQKKLSSKKIIVDGIIKENLNLKKYKYYFNNRKLIFKNINKKTFSLNDLYAPIIGINIDFENTQKIKFHLNKQKYFLNKKRKFKLIFENGKK